MVFSRKMQPARGMYEKQERASNAGSVNASYDSCCLTWDYPESVAGQAVERTINARRIPQESDERQVQDNFVSSIVIIA